MAVLLLIPAGHSMARVAVVGIAVAEPESYGAAVPALEVDIVCAMLVAVLLPSTNDTCRAFRAHEVLSPVVLHHLLVVSAVSHAPKVGSLAFEAHVVGHLEQREFFQVLIEAVTRILQPRVFVKTFKLCPLYGLRLYDVPDGFDRGKGRAKRAAVVQLHRLFAAWTVHEAKDDARGGPFVLDDCLQAIDMKDVPAAEPHAGFCPKSRNPAYRAVCVLIYTLLQDFWIVL